MLHFPKMAPYADFCGAVVSSDNRVTSYFVGSNQVLSNNIVCQISRERKSTKSVENLDTSQQKYGVMEKTWSPAYSVNDEIDVSSRKDLAIDDKKKDQKIISSEEQKFVQEIDLETRKNYFPTVDGTTSSLEHLVDLYRKATGAEIFANEAIQMKTLLEENGNILAYGTNSNLNCADDSTQRIADHLFVEPVSELSDKRDTLVIEPTAEDMSLPQELSPSECHGSAAILRNKEGISVCTRRHCENFCDCPGFAHEVKGIPSECNANSPEYLNYGPLDYEPCHS
ncbi:unnamed protein product [Rhizophagus irregularis]|nr:unnamed protein product [Rhizophagus irregularis]